MASKRILRICTLAITGIILLSTVSEAIDSCKSYNDILDNGRDISSRSGLRCDKDLKTDWYRFFIEGESAVMPTQCVKPGNCGTQLGMYANLHGQQMPPVGVTLQATACASYSILDHWSCCALRVQIYIRHCPGGFYIYHLGPTDRCPVSYCAVKNSSYVESRVTVRHGYHVSYVETTVPETTVPEITTQKIETTETTDVTTVPYQEDNTIRANLKAVQTTEEPREKATLMNVETTQKMEITSLPVVDDEKRRLDELFGSGSQEPYDHGTSHISYEVSTLSSQDKEKSTTVQLAVIPATTSRSVPVIDKVRPVSQEREPAELIFLLNGHDKEDVLASFHANFTAAMQRANRNIHNITIKELCPIGDAIKILFWAYDTNGKLIPGFKVEENMEMREKVEEALGLRPLPQRQDIFQEYLALFIILIIIGFLCLIILLSSCMYLYCRRHSGHWDRALAEQYHVTVVPRREARIAESPYSDEAIMSDEMLEKSHSNLGSHYPGVGDLHDLSYPNSLSGIKAMNNKNTFNTYPSSYGSLPKDGIEGLVVPIDQLKPEKDALIIEDTVL